MPEPEQYRMSPLEHYLTARDNIIEWWKDHAGGEIKYNRQKSVLNACGTVIGTVALACEMIFFGPDYSLQEYAIGVITGVLTTWSLFESLRLSKHARSLEEQNGSGK